MTFLDECGEVCRYAAEWVDGEGFERVSVGFVSGRVFRSFMPGWGVECAVVRVVVCDRYIGDQAVVFVDKVEALAVRVVGVWEHMVYENFATREKFDFVRDFGDDAGAQVV